MNIEQIGNLVGFLIAACIAGWVRFDAKKRGLSSGAAIGWGVGVFLLLIVFLPLYFWKRSQLAAPTGSSRRPTAPIAGLPCQYCGYPNEGNVDFCGKCGRQLRKSTEIHR